jgi:hypothetical protein
MTGLPLFHSVRKVRASAPALDDAAGAVRAVLAPLLAAGELRGRRVAITCGSRGIDRIGEVVPAACRALCEAGAQPFIVPAMGSHGNATAEGQRKVLAEYGITEASSGVPIVSSMETVVVGRSPAGIEVAMDRAAFEAGRILLLHRVKPHTTFDGEVESGLMKMMAVGLGKLDGARHFHNHAMRLGFSEVILEMGRLALASGKIWAGVGLVENDEHRLAEVQAAPAAEVEALDRRLLLRARQLYARLPFSELDLLIVDEIGKNIAGTGMDPKVIGRPAQPDVALRLEGVTRIRRIYACDLTAESKGNANGIGLADVIHKRLFDKIDFPTSYTNGRAALNSHTLRLPMYFSSDAEALEFLLGNLGSPAPEQLRAARIRNTLALSELLASPAAVSQLAGNDRYEIGPAQPLQLD